MGTSRSTPSVFLLEKAKTLGVKSDEVTEIVLEFAGITALMEKGGLILKDHDKTMPEPSIGETHCPCSIRSAAHLKEILEGKMDEAWGEFVFYCQEEKKIIPFEFLPQLIHYCRGDKKIWLALRPIVGQRGAWLVAQNPDWQHLLTENPLETASPQYQTLSKDNTMALANDILKTIYQYGLVFMDDKKITIDLKDLAFHSPIDLHETLFTLFSNDLPYQWQQKINILFNTLRFRKEMVKTLKS